MVRKLRVSTRVKIDNRLRGNRVCDTTPIVAFVAVTAVVAVAVATIAIAVAVSSACICSC